MYNRKAARKCGAPLKLNRHGIGGKNMKKTRTITSVTIALALVLCLAATAYATTICWNTQVHAWNQANSTSTTLGEYSFSGDQTMVFDAFAWAEYDGYFNIKLYKKNWYGGWDQVGYNYTRSQTSSVTTSTSPRGDNSMGDWFQVYWAMNGAGTYKIVLDGATNPYGTMRLYHIYWYSYNS